jgi:hypothetical protein
LRFRYKLQMNKKKLFVFLCEFYCTSQKFELNIRARSKAVRLNRVNCKISFIQQEISKAEHRSQPKDTGPASKHGLDPDPVFVHGPVSGYCFRAWTESGPSLTGSGHTIK